ncbi:hypothetical protein AFM11_10505 [Mycolicibacterium wolinskyi]|uniref:Secreted protein n=1 Tax=Mycolicibacterium wolinskyi TaxID=59750 RepID=A0A132PPX3_9MYCO|nr:hypothetical protein [Mycolicibacterium wolinskyi]KWX24389.1 hypothetical protein AFM11_10505 [Mycolicibacterium wolinskyi]
MRSVSALATAAGALTLIGGGLTVAVPAAADTPVLHHVRYTVTSDAPFWAEIYYRATDPPTWSDYSHNPYQFSPKAEADIGPNQPWVYDAMLADPDSWAMVTVQSGDGPGIEPPRFHCRLEVDGAVVKTNSGNKGALCSLRNW